ncbi:Lrp/AsnC ligand binding domain-containing protein [Natronomonas sp. EA1]|uniref:Lrp/AsnC ligand binding domain-containing protein n=1 Tax=Natronomonas sp. EA1 TaxID=3421655 RepID=UPI003EBA65B0
MVRAFIMVKATSGDAEPLVADIGALELVVDAHIVAGDYDIIVEVLADEVYQVLHEVSTRIRGMDQVADTKTYICLE